MILPNAGATADVRSPARYNTHTHTHPARSVVLLVNRYVLRILGQVHIHGRPQARGRGHLPLEML